MPLSIRRALSCAMRLTTLISITLSVPGLADTTPMAERLAQSGAPIYGDLAQANPLLAHHYLLKPMSLISCWSELA